MRHGLIKKVGRTYKYYLTQFGKKVITTGLKLKELVAIPQPASATAPEANFLPELVRIQMERY